MHHSLLLTSSLNLLLAVVCSLRSTVPLCSSSLLLLDPFFFSSPALKILTRQLTLLRSDIRLDSIVFIWFSDFPIFFFFLPFIFHPFNSHAVTVILDASDPGNNSIPVTLRGAHTIMVSFKKSRSSLASLTLDESELQRLTPSFASTTSSSSSSALRRSSTFGAPPPPTANYSIDIAHRPEFLHYTVPVNLDPRPAMPRRVEEQYVASSIFTGGSNSLTRVHFMEKVSDSKTCHPQMAGANGSPCRVPGCARTVMSDERGLDLVPCDCGYAICNNCYLDEVKKGAGGEEGAGGGAICKGCNKPYEKAEEPVEEASEASGMSRMERRLSLMRSVPSILPVRSRSSGDRDDEPWLFETKRSYGYGSAMWPSEEGGYGDGDHDLEVNETIGLVDGQWKPLTRINKIPAAVLVPYRLLILMRIIVLILFLAWRVEHPNKDAMWLWGMSVICEIWFAFSWLLDQLPKLFPVNRSTDLSALEEKFEKACPPGKFDLPDIDVFVSTADPVKEPPLVTANTILSILAADYPVEKLSCYVSDDGGALLTFEAMAEAATFANIWVPFCRKHAIEPRNPESYFNLKKDPLKSKLRHDFVKDRRRVKREYDEFKVRINALPDSIRRRSGAYHAHHELVALKHRRQNPDPNDEEEEEEVIKIPKATWMPDGSHWPGTWIDPAPHHSRGDHTGIIQVMLKPPSNNPLFGEEETEGSGYIDFTDVDIRLPMLVYVSREKRPGYDHNKKAGAMNALVRASALMSNGPLILNIDCDHYFYNSRALREGVCFMLDHGGNCICYVQFPQRFEGIDPSDRYANSNTVFFDVNMRALDGLQGPIYVGTGCLFRRIALYGFDPPISKDSSHSFWSCCFGRKQQKMDVTAGDENISLGRSDYDEKESSNSVLLKKFGNSLFLVKLIRAAVYIDRLLADYTSVNNGNHTASLAIGRVPLGATTVAEAIDVISCWYEDKTEWGKHVGWIYGSVTEDVVTGFRMHNRGWKSVYCVTKPDAFRGTAPINLTDRLHQVLRWATGSVEIFFSRNNALLASSKMKFLQKIAYLNVGIYPFTSVFLIVYCFLPALSLVSGQFIIRTLNITFLVYLMVITITLSLLAVLEIKWSGINLEQWWRNEQFWLIGGISAHLAAVLQGLLKVVAGIEISFTLTSKASGDDDDEFADLYRVKWTTLMIPPLVIIMVNVIGIAVGFTRTIYSTAPEWSRLISGVFFSFWVLAHLCPFAKGLMGRRGGTPTIIFIWSGLLAITISLLWVAVNPQADTD